MLQRALEYGGAPPIALSAVLKIGNELEAEEFQARVIPIVTKLFTSQVRQQSSSPPSVHLRSPCARQRCRSALVHISTGTSSHLTNMRRGTGHELQYARRHHLTPLRISHLL